MSDKEKTKLKDLVNGSFLFKALAQSHRDELIESAAFRSFAPGEVIIREDEEGLELMILAKGKVRVSTLGPGGDVDLADLGPGALLGEVSVLAQTPRTSTVTAVDDVTVVAIVADTVREIAEANPKVKETMFRIIEGRARHTITMIPQD